MKVDDKTASRIIVVSGPSGSGKTTIVEAACELEPSLQRVPTATTRARRPGEVDGESYLFMDEDEFSAREEEGLFLETACVHGNHYGTPRNAVDTFLEHGLTPICILDPAGAASVRAAYPGQVLSIFVDAGDQELRRRLEERVDADDILVQTPADARPGVAGSSYGTGKTRPLDSARTSALRADIDRRMADAVSFRGHEDEYDVVLLNEWGDLSNAVRGFACICQEPISALANEFEL